MVFYTFWYIKEHPARCFNRGCSVEVRDVFVPRGGHDEVQGENPLLAQRQVLELEFNRETVKLRIINENIPQFRNQDISIVVCNHLMSVPRRIVHGLTMRELHNVATSFQIEK